MQLVFIIVSMHSEATSSPAEITVDISICTGRGFCAWSKVGNENDELFVPTCGTEIVEKVRQNTRKIARGSEEACFQCFPIICR